MIVTQRGREEHLFWIDTQSSPPDFGLSEKTVGVLLGAEIDCGALPPQERAAGARDMNFICKKGVAAATANMNVQ